jgi:hypothetical protein
MKNMVETWIVKAVGNSPWLQHALTLEAVERMQERSNKTKPEAAVKDEEYYNQLENEWRETCFFDEKIGFYVPDEYIEGNLKRAGTQIKLGRGSLKGSVLKGIVAMDKKNPVTLPSKYTGIKTKDDIEKAGLVIKHKVRVHGSPASRKRVMLPDPWEFSFRLSVDEDVINKSNLEKILRKGGEIGFADWNPKYGTFDIISVKKG